jgi:dephospho-CoA kinase
MKQLPDEPADGPLVIGILGGIGSGKSTVAAMLGELGATVVDADKIAHTLLENKEICAEVVRAFGSSILGPGGHIVRERLRSVFRSEDDLRRLEGILHPHVIEDIRHEVGRHRKAGAGSRSVLVLDVPLLLEKGLQDLADVLVFVDAPRSVRLERLQKRSKIDEEELARREKLQSPINFKEDVADCKIDSGRSLDEMRRQVGELWRSLVTDSGSP